MKRDRVKDIRDRLTRIADQDTRVIAAIDRFADFSVEELGGFLKMPDESFPMHGFKSKREVRLALMGNMPKKDWPAAAQAAHERVGYVIRKEDKAPSGAQHGLIGIPVWLIGDAAPPADKMLVMRRNSRGELEPRELPPVDAEEVGPGTER